MEYFDLNISPITLKDKVVDKAINDLIIYLINQPTNQSYFKNLTIDYDKNTKIFTINDNNFAINLLAFIQQFNYQTTEIKTYLASAISILVANQIKISFKSNNGVFYPIIRNKDITGAQIPSIFIAYEKISNEENTSSLASNRTAITLNPIDYSIIDELKINFSFLYTWTKVLQTKYGMVLIGNNQTNNFFLNGKKVVIHNSNENDDKHGITTNKMHFVFSYDCNQNAFNFPIFTNKYEPSQDEYECINKILENLNDVDKEAIFSKIINDNQSYEWNNQLIRTTIIEYLTKLKSKTYVIGQKDYQQAAYEAFAKKVNIHIIWISDDEYRKLDYEQHIPALDDFERKYAQENIDVDKLKFIDPNDLNKDEKATFKVIKRFLDTFIERFIDWTEEMHDGDDEWYEEDHMDLNDLKNLKIVEGLPSPSRWYESVRKIGLLERTDLTSLSWWELFEEVRGIVLAGTEGITDCEFDEVWNDTMAAEIVNCYSNHHDKKSIKTTKLKAKK